MIFSVIYNKMFFFFFRVTRASVDESAGAASQAAAASIKTGLTGALSAAAAPAIEVAKSLSVQGDTSSIPEVLPTVKEQCWLEQEEKKDIQTKTEADIANAIRKISLQKQPGLSLATAGAGDPCIDAEADIDEDKEEFIPHFQRVSVSGDDNTGVSKIFLIENSYQ